MRDWRHLAVWGEEDPELFFPVGTAGPALLQIAEAKAVCRRCPVVTECLTWALECGQDAGVWGGMSEDERRALKRRNARTRTRPADDPAAPGAASNRSRVNPVADPSHR
jgi:WhiB family redox-sensing transcriptional regulator